jgi:hypothetical protein
MTNISAWVSLLPPRLPELHLFLRLRRHAEHAPHERVAAPSRLVRVVPIGIGFALIVASRLVLRHDPNAPP